MSNPFPAIAVLRSYETSGLRLEETIYPENLHYPRHVHEPAYVAFFLAGSVTEHYLTNSAAFGTSTLIYHPPGEAHAFHIGETGLRALTVELQPESTTAP